MQNYRLPIWIISILGCVLIIFTILLSANQFQLINGGTQLLSVSATGKTEAIQDIAIVTIGVIAEGLTAPITIDQSNNKMNQVLSFIKQSGIDEKDIKTSQFYITPKYSYNNQQQTIIGYQANQTVTVKVRNIDKSSKQLQLVIDGAITHGANQIQGIDFSFDNNENLINNARKQAIDKAKINAQQITTDAGLKLGRIVNVITTTLDNPAPMSVPNIMLAKSSSTTIESGSQEVSATVTVIFEVR